ncbi:MAG: MarR family winged helix-turn-helix transcriptional regulator [Pseudorhodoplanes sp.]
MSQPNEEHLLYRLPGYLLRRSAQAWMGRLTERLSPLDLRISDASALLLIGERTDMTSSEIGKNLDIKSANMAPLLGRLESQGLIARAPIDGKSQAVRLTESGHKYLKKVRTITSQLEQDILAAIPETHRDHFVPALRALLELDSA